ncbi:MAG: cytochrome c biogenesis protein CcsA [Chlamydiae bacterium]|nr:cytochrome c biogenesis protein CcsA [Chlamydiota bacterium]MBI3276325.1 cytochrome c biogenesis protein CcsA [Chlamydiota bacterium]
MQKRFHFSFFIFHFSLLCFMLLALWAIFLWAPIEKTMGDVQRIFYFHVPSAWVSFLSFLVVFISSLLYLITRKNIFDHTAQASAELGVLFSSFVLITGPLWAKPVWGIWWTWDARLTSTLVLWLIYISYLMLRSFIPQEQKKKTLSAVLGIVGFIDVPIVYLSIRWWRTQHPAPVIGGGEGSGIDPVMFKTLMISFAAFLLFYFLLMKLRLGILKAANELKEIRELFTFKS